MSEAALDGLSVEEKRRLLQRLIDEKRGIPRQAPASFAQERMWFLDQMSPERAAYNLVVALRMRGPLDAGALERALSEIVRRHEVLRTTFQAHEGSPAQVIHPARPLALPPEPVADEAALLLAVKAETRTPFDLAAGPLFRARLLRLREDEHVLLASMHHIVSDGWSLGVFTAELSALYSAFARGEASPLPRVEVQYADFAAWQREQLQGEALDAELAYWTERLRGAPALLELPTDRPRPAVQRQVGAREHATLPAALVTRLRELAREERSTLYMVLLAAWSVLLSRYSGQGEVVVGSPIAGRPRRELEGAVGLFVNTLALRVDLAGDPAFRDLLARVRETTLGAYQHPNLPFEKLVEALAPERSLGHSPLFQVLFSLQTARQPAPALDGLEVTRVPVAEQDSAKFDLSFLVRESDDGLAAMLEYRTDLFDADTVQRILEHYALLLEGIAADPRQRISALPMLGLAERERIAEWNATATEYPSGCIHQLFEAQAARTPDAVALVSEGLTLTYSELDQSANRLAHYLRARGIGPESRVAVCLERGLDMVVALFGVLKAGGAYVPLDPDYPRDRLAHMLADSGAALLLTVQPLRDRLPEHAAVLCLDIERDAIAAEPPAALDSAVRPANLAYVIYTSGSTGTPKGAMNQHGGVVNRLLWMQSEYGLDASDVVLQKTPFSFDVSVWEFFWPLATGARLVMARPGGHRDPAYLVETIQAESVTTLHFVPSMLEHFLAEPGVEGCTTVRRVVCSGEALPPELRTRFFARMGAELHNLYGPTEAAVDVSAWECTSDETGCVPIGRPIANTRLYVLDAELAPVPVGVPGELFIAGTQVGRGYLARPGLTAEKFIPDPFTPGARMYRTGDRARWMASGALEYLGRVDFQVKLRGFRIELGEIEAALREQTGVREAVAIVRGGPADPRLVAYVVGESAESARLRDALRTRLPEYMVPAAVVVLDALPLSPNGKVDRKALPAPEMGAEREGYVAARTPVEEVLCGVWAEVLRVERVGVNDDFFTLGGHSLLATRVVARVREAFAAEITLRAFFEAPTPARLARYVESARRGGSAAPLPRIVPTPRGDTAPVSFAQERMWFFDQMEPGSAVYNIPLALRLRGALDVEALEGALTEIVRRHEVLRTTFRSDASGPVQIVHPAHPIALPVEAVQDEAALEEEARRPFDLAAGPLFRARLLRLRGDEHVLLVSMHHIVSDGWSLGVFARELSALYGAFARGEESPLAPPAVQYADFAAWQREQLQGARLDAELAYWTERLRGAPALLELPTDRPRPAVQSHHGASHRFTIPAPLVAELRALGQREGATLYMVLLAAWSVLLARYSGQEEVVVGSPIAGRTQSEVEGLIGLFVNTLALRVDLTGNPAFRDLLKQVRGTTLGAYEHQDLPFEKLVEALAPERSAGHSPIFQALLSLQNAPAEVIQMAGLDVEPARVQSETTKFDLSLFATERDGELELALRYRTELYEAETTQRMLKQYRLLLEGIAAGPTQRAADLPLMDAEEREQVLVEWNCTNAEITGGCIHELVEAQAARTPGAIALVADDRTLTYAELDQAANRLAHHLRARRIGPESRVAVCLERSVDLVVALLGTLKAGGAYVPMDPAYPRERLRFMLEDCGAGVLLTHEQLLSALPEADVVCLDRDRNAIAREPGTALESAVRPENPAYVIYTSGSTGTPKGVVVEHRQLLNLVRWHQTAFGVTAEDRATQLAGVGFDAAAWEIWPYLTAGARLVIPSDEDRVSPEALGRVLAEQGVTISFMPTPLAQRFLALDDAPTTLRTLLTGGDRLLPHGRASLPYRLVNNYGPTEATVVASSLEIVSGEPLALPSIGRPLTNVRAYVLDASLAPVPVGVPGELFVGGAQVARGYLGRPALTAERFIPDPFAGGRMYRTGDRVRWLAHGTLEFLGRTDDQVKLRGFRIEPGEIEAALRTHAAVNEAVVMVREDVPGDARLVAYVAASPAPSEGELRAHLKTGLPEYMVPSAFVLLEALPLTPNGKVDRRALPAPEWGERDGYVAPSTPVEEVLCAVWAELLGGERVGVNDHFFEVGGHSLLATQLLARVRETFLVELPLRAFFDAPTVAGLAAALTNDAETRMKVERIAALVVELSALDDDEATALLPEGDSPEPVAV